MLKNFANNVGAKTYGDIYGSWWPGSMEKLEANISSSMSSADRLHFNLDQIDPVKFKAFTQNPSFRDGNITNWELNTILNNPSLLEKATFYGPGGTVVPPPVW